MATKLTQCVVPPNRLASIISWGPSASTVMGLDITDERIGVAIARHPSPNNRVTAIEPIPYVTNDKRAYYNTRRYDDNERVAMTLDQLAKKHKISGFVVGWPLQPDGRPGGPCGKVLHLLDYLAEHPSPILYKHRPFALWDLRDIPFNAVEDHLVRCHNHECDVDKWGRAKVFSRTPSQSVGSYLYRSSDQFYHSNTNDSKAATLMLKHYMDSHWEPEEEEEALHFNEADEDTAASAKFSHDVETYNQDDMYYKSSLL
uniref:Holliday junction resolvase n=1 Tax=Minutocellus polymorphus TaxID=265543 RepID=A0A6U0IGH0_9STRA